MIYHNLSELGVSLGQYALGGVGRCLAIASSGCFGMTGV